MFQVTGQIINLFDSPKTEKYEASFKVQILGETATIDGQIKKEMLTLNVPLSVFNSLKGRTGQDITLPVGFYVKGNNLITFFPKSEEKNLTLDSTKS